ncbi:MAG: amidase, partial [Gemmatimonadetes bacterium]|nr:amidase [Gemmatimonadota bacterium]
AEKVAGLQFSDAEREEMVRGLDQNLASWEQLRTVEINNAVSPALRFDPVLPGVQLPTERKKMRLSNPPKVQRPANLEELAFWPVRHLAELVRSRKVSAVELTEMYLARLTKHGPSLQAVITTLDDRAMKQARQADADIKSGHYRGPLHGIPWGAKDLLAVRGYRTTWGAKPYEEQVIDMDATVVQRLDQAGAVLIAKLTLGALAQGDQWFGGQTRNPWNTEQGSSGSSAGPAACTAGGLVGFSIGTETRGSIVSPATRCGVTGLRPTYGRVSRHGAMALAWSMDKIGPICRSVEDCALVLDAIQGPDGQDLTVRDVPFNWDAAVKPTGLRVGYLKSAFETETNHPTKAFDDAALDAIRRLGVTPLPVELPTRYPVNALSGILSAEAAAAFDDITRNQRVNLLERSSWPTTFRTSQLIPAVDYVQANRVRTLLMQATHDAFKDFDAIVAPTGAANLTALTNLTGQPCVVVPSGFRDDGTPVSVSFIGNLFGEAGALALAKAYQDATGFHTRKPPKFV